VPCIVAEATNAVCGADFTVWLSSVEGSSILTAGLPQYGQLGHGTDNEYNAKDSSVKLTYDPQPRPRAIATFSGKTVVKVACGTNHTGFPRLSFFRVIMINTDINPISLLLCCSCS